MIEINWIRPNPDLPYSQTLIYSSSAKYGTYTTLVTLSDIRTTKYVHAAGTTSTWYKWRFFDGTNYSDYSTPIQGSYVVGDFNYTTPKIVGMHLNNFRRITSEAVGSGDGTTVKFGPLAEQFPIEDSETVYVAATAKVRNVDYTVDYETGYVTFVTASKPTSGQAITADYWTNAYCTNDRVIDAIKRAEDEINRKLRRSFYQPVQITEYVDSFDPLDTKPYSYEARNFSDMAQDYQPKMNEAVYSRLLKLEKYPITSVQQVLTNAQPTSTTSEAVGTGAGVVTVFYLDNYPVVYDSEIIYVAGVQVTNYTIDNTTGTITFAAAPTGAITADYTYCTSGTIVAAADYMTRLESGLIYLKETASQIKQNPLICAVTYTHGYETVPGLIEHLVTLTAMVEVMTSSIMGAPQAQDVSRSNIDAVRREIELIYDSLGRVMELTRI